MCSSRTFPLYPPPGHAITFRRLKRMSYGGLIPDFGGVVTTNFYGAAVTISPDGGVTLTRGRWQATIPASG